MFINFLNLSQWDICKNNMVIFYGESGTWKSTYLQYIMNDMSWNDYVFLLHKEKKITFQSYKQQYIFIDEIVNIYWLYVLIRYLINGKNIVVATHVHPIIYKFLFWLFVKWKYFTTDINNGKIEKYLEHKWYIYTQESIEDFIENFWENFIDLEIILNYKKNSNDFWKILSSFLIDCKIVSVNNY